MSAKKDTALRPGAKVRQVEIQDAARLAKSAA
jgi:hypothetical protein